MSAHMSGGRDGRGSGIISVEKRPEESWRQYTRHYRHHATIFRPAEAMTAEQIFHIDACCVTSLFRPQPRCAGIAAIDVR